MSLAQMKKSSSLDKLLGAAQSENQTQENVFKVIFLVFVVIGSSLDLSAVIGFSFSMTLAMAFPNIIGLYAMAPVVKDELQAFMADIKSGKVVFAK